MKILIATTKFPPTIEVAKVFAEDLRRNAEACKAPIVSGITWAKGPACHNLAFEVGGDEDAATQFANQMSLALMPSRWCKFVDESPTEDMLFGEVIQ